MTYEYDCPKGHVILRTRPMSDPSIDRVYCKEHRTLAEWHPFAVRTVFGRTVGRDSGFYTLDYGKRATEDLTVPGKLDRLKKAGTIQDPFDAKS